jgi:hypothetical protein
MSGRSVRHDATLYIAAEASLTLARSGAGSLLWRDCVRLPAYRVMQGCCCKACVLRTHSEGACWRWLEHMPWSADGGEERQRNAGVPDAVVMAVLTRFGMFCQHSRDSSVHADWFNSNCTQGFVHWHCSREAAPSACITSATPGAVQERFWHMDSWMPGSVSCCCRATCASVAAFMHSGQAIYCVSILLYTPEWLCTSTTAAGLLSLAHWACFLELHFPERTYYLELI